MACDPTVAETIETLTERLQTSTLLEDRRDACRGLRSLSKDYRVQVGAQAMDPLMQIIMNDRHDTEIVNYCLDSLNNIISGPLADSPPGTWPEVDDRQSNAITTPNYNTPPAPNKSSRLNSANATSTTSSSHDSNYTHHDPGRELAEIFMKRAENVTTIVETTKDNHPRTRWVVLRILCGLARHKLEMLQDSILSDPMNLATLTQLLIDEQEYIRYDGLVLFVQLTQSNQNIQNVLAYENCFDRILQIIKEEDYLNGTVVVVNDCLNILLNLIQYNESNQILFREGGHIQKLVPFFELMGQISFVQDPDDYWTQPKINCIVLVLQIVDSLIAPTNSPENVRRCQGIMHDCRLLDKLCQLLTASRMPVQVLFESMHTASDMVRGHLGSNASTVMPTSSMMPILLLGIAKEMIQDQERKISELYNYMHVLHGFVSGNASSSSAVP